MTASPLVGEPGLLALLREEPLREVDPLFQLVQRALPLLEFRHARPQVLDLGRERRIGGRAPLQAARQRPPRRSPAT